MNEAKRLEVIQMYQSGVSYRQIALNLGISRGAVARAIARWRKERAGQSTKPARKCRGSVIDPFEPLLKELLAKYPNLTAKRALEELRGRGFTGGYTVLSERLRLLRPKPMPKAVPRFETEPGQQAQMDFGVYDIDFVREGRRRVYLFSYLLGYSRRQYLCWVESMDLATVMCHHVKAFHYLGGVARVCLYDNFKAVVLSHDADGPVYNPKFLAFATHYGFRPQACRVRRPQTKGKVEREFYFVEKNLLNARTFDTLEHLNEVTQTWQRDVADVRILHDFKESPGQRHEREQPYLLALPQADYDTALVVYRHVNVEGFVAYRLNFYSVPWSYIGQVLPVRIVNDEVIIYSISLEEIARHPRLPSTVTSIRQSSKGHHPQSDSRQREQFLRERFVELGPIATRFLDGLLAKQTYGKLQAQQLLALAAHYHRDDLLRAMERAVHFGAFSLAAMRRILAASAHIKPLFTQLYEIDPSLRDEPISPRPTSDYQDLLSLEDNDETSTDEKPPTPEEPTGSA